MAVARLARVKATAEGVRAGRRSAAWAEVAAIVPLRVAGSKRGQFSLLLGRDGSAFAGRGDAARLRHQRPLPGEVPQVPEPIRTVAPCSMFPVRQATFASACQIMAAAAVVLIMGSVTLADWSQRRLHTAEWMVAVVMLVVCLAIVFPLRRRIEAMGVFLDGTGLDVVSGGGRWRVDFGDMDRAIVFAGTASANRLAVIGDDVAREVAIPHVRFARSSLTADDAALLAGELNRRLDGETLPRGELIVPRRRAAVVTCGLVGFAFTVPFTLAQLHEANTANEIRSRSVLTTVTVVDATNHGSAQWVTVALPEPARDRVELTNTGAPLHPGDSAVVSLDPHDPIDAWFDDQRRFPPGAIDDTTAGLTGALIFMTGVAMIANTYALWRGPANPQLRHRPNSPDSKT